MTNRYAYENWCSITFRDVDKQKCAQIVAWNRDNYRDLKIDFKVYWALPSYIDSNDIKYYSQLNFLS